MRNKVLPRLCKAMAKQAILNEGEARSAFVAHRQKDGRWGGAEAAVHYGGATKAISDSFKNRSK